EGRALGRVSAAVQGWPVVRAVDVHGVDAGAGPVGNAVVQVARRVDLVRDAGGRVSVPTTRQAGDEDLGARVEVQRGAQRRGVVGDRQEVADVRGFVAHEDAVPAGAEVDV